MIRWNIRVLVEIGQK